MRKTKAKSATPEKNILNLFFSDAAEMNTGG
jgi:hypothetical protein